MLARVLLRADDDPREMEIEFQRERFATAERAGA